MSLWEFGSIAYLLLGGASALCYFAFADGDAGRKQRHLSLFSACILLAPFLYGVCLWVNWFSQRDLLEVYQQHQPDALTAQCPSWINACLPPELIQYQYQAPLNVNSIQPVKNGATRGDTVLHLAVRKNNARGIVTLLHHGADPLIEGDFDSPFHEAARYGLPKVMYVFLSSGIPIDTKTRFGDTALTTSLEGRNHAMTRFLLTVGADVRITDSNGDTPLHIAVRNADEKMIRLLLDFGANPLVFNTSLVRPLDDAEVYCPQFVWLLQRAVKQKQERRKKFGSTQSGGT